MDRDPPSRLRGPARRRRTGCRSVGFVASTDATLYDVTPISEDEGVDERSFATLFAFDLLAVLPA